MFKFMLSLVGLSIFTLSLTQCSNQKVPPTRKDEVPPSQAKPVEAQPQPSATPSSERIQGNCIQMQPPGSSDEQITPCNKLALQLIYEKDQRMAIAVVRTETDGRFELNLPKNTKWRLAPTSSDWHTEVELFKNTDGSQKIMAILKPTTLLTQKSSKKTSK